MNDDYYTRKASKREATADLLGVVIAGFLLVVVLVQLARLVGWP